MTDTTTLSTQAQITEAMAAADRAMAAIQEATAGHTPGHGYALTRVQFLRVLEELYGSALFPADWQEPWCDLRGCLWQTIAAAEARRVFDFDMGACPSELRITYSYMEWEYVTTSGTALLALDHRYAGNSRTVTVTEGDLCDLQLREDHLPDYCLPWVRRENQDHLAIPTDGIYRVVIPADRDQPGRTAWTQIRLALSGLSFRNYCESPDRMDACYEARRILAERLTPAATPTA